MCLDRAYHSMVCVLFCCVFSKPATVACNFQPVANATARQIFDVDEMSIDCLQTFPIGGIQADRKSVV